MNFNPIKIHIYTYLFLILILILLFINNFIYLPQYEIKSSVLLAAKSSFSKKDNLITVSQVNDRDIISLWLTESNVLRLIENKNCNKIKTEKYSKINILNVKTNNTLNINILGSDPNIILACYSEIIDSINLYQKKYYNKYFNPFNLANYNYIPAMSVAKNNEILFSRASYLKNTLNIILAVILSIQIIMIIRYYFKI
jgi:hypothetical protein